MQSAVRTCATGQLWLDCSNNGTDLSGHVVSADRQIKGKREIVIYSSLRKYATSCEQGGRKSPASKLYHNQGKESNCHSVKSNRVISKIIGCRYLTRALNSVYSARACFIYQIDILNYETLNSPQPISYSSDGCARISHECKRSQSPGSDQCGPRDEKEHPPRSLSTLAAQGYIRQDDETVRHCLGSNFRERRQVRLQPYSIDDMENKASVALSRPCATTWDTLSPL
jgi:hypothetical protein